MQNDIVGMEVIEINPLLDGSVETMLLANRVVHEVLAGMAVSTSGWDFRRCQMWTRPIGIRT